MQWWTTPSIMDATSDEDGRLELGVNAQRFPLDMPVDHDAAAAVADVPLRRQVLVPGAEVLGIGRAGRRPVAPDRRVAGVQRAVGRRLAIARRSASTVI